MSSVTTTPLSLAAAALLTLASCGGAPTEGARPAEETAARTAPEGATPDLTKPERPTATTTDTPPASVPQAASAEAGEAAAPAAAASAATASAATDAPPAELSRFADPEQVADADLGNYHVRMRCSVAGEDVGTMTFALWTDLAPITTRNFLRLCDEGFYDGLTFHRILREFMVQGGDPTGTGGGNGPHGTIQGEMSEDPARAHGYGVLSMARMGSDLNSASCQFFLCCDESPSVWGLDGKYASFGRLTSGVETLERIANVPTRAVRSPEPSSPLETVTIVDAEVVEGPAPTGETIARPEEPLDLGGEARKIVVQHILVSFEGCGVPEVTRTQEEAEALARELLAKVQAGEDMGALAREHSDDPIMPTDDTPGYYAILNLGVKDRAGDRIAFDVQRQLQAEFTEKSGAMRAELSAQTITQEQFNARMTELQQSLQGRMMDVLSTPRDQLVPAFGDVGFSLEPGAVGLATYDEKASPFGYHVIRRVE